MTAALGVWFPERQRMLHDQLVGFWAADTWDMAACPLLTRPLTRHWFIHFGCTSPPLNWELKYACWQKFVRHDWTIATIQAYAARIHQIVKWLNQAAPDTRSLLEHDLLFWERSLRMYVVEHGLWHASTTRKLNATNAVVEYPKEDPRICIFRAIYRLLQETYDARSEVEKDVWDLRKIGITINLSRSEYWLKFTRIRQGWLHEVAKRFVQYHLVAHSAPDCRKKLQALQLFSAFLDKQHPALAPSELTRAIIVDYLGFIPQQLSAKTRAMRILDLRTVLDVCVREGWADVPDRPLIYDDDIPHRPKAEPRFIPEEVLEQLNRQLDALGAPIVRMVIIVQEDGMRISELCGLAWNCLHQDGDGDWWLRYYQGKLKKEHSIPITQEVLAVIREQQAWVRATYGQDCRFLFPNHRKPDQPSKQYNFAAALNRLVVEKDIRDATGQLFHFQAHQFRHTVGTRMINRGYPQHIVQRYLGHETPLMTSVYAHLHDDTLKREFEKFARDQVDVSGNKGKLGTVPFDLTDLHWFKQNVHAQALPNGTCWLPATKGKCPHANACLTCTHFRTDSRFLAQHKAQLAETQQLLERARANGWERQIEMNEQVARNMERIIITLEQVPQ